VTAEPGRSAGGRGASPPEGSLARPWRDPAIRLGIAALVVLLAVLLGGSSASSSTPIAGDAAKLVPEDALVYVHVSTDGDRPATRRAAELANRFPSWPAFRDSLVKRLSAPGCDAGTRALRSAKEAALALFDVGGGGTANSLVLVDTGRPHARATQTGCGTLSLQYVGHFLAIGQPESVKVAEDLAAGKGRSLADAPAPRQQFAQLPGDRVVDGWVSQAGVRRLLAPQGGLLGAIGVLFDQPALRGAAFGLEPQGEGAHLVVRSVLDPATARRNTSGFKPFEPSLQDAVPARAMAYLGVSNLGPALRRLLSAAGAGSDQLGAIVGDIDPNLLKLFQGESAIVLLPAAPAPVLALVARTSDEAATRQALAKLPAALRRAFKTAVFDGKVVVATSQAGIDAIRDPGTRLTDTDQWRKAVGDHPDRVSSLVFLDFSRLLQLGEQTGLGDSRAYQAYKRDLQQVRAIGAHTSGSGSESTAEISLLLSTP
jgi:hypothetical protein